ncbi:MULTISPECIES: alpha/beta hydrolase [unclassified Moorena]|uniref:alpha/beta hydrolase n=1 Tax=unclassified Moorena TaxID=2683338 RepID=UPI001401AB7E|nr:MULTISPECIES: alpha/beta hydrolase [unclassified Moorena]NEO14641.1 alpha/beta hydrolase [Moorena sp. SIO3E8]NEQ01899.1 alpha/beta hydrolase [Moorena sp. SIO3F7]
MFNLILNPGKNEISFKSQGYTLAANLYVPRDFDPSNSYPAVIYSPPFNQVKEQSGAIYCHKLAEKGYVALAFDHVGYGDSEGEIRNYENANIKMESIRDGISFLGTLPFVNRDRLFGLGMCASGGYMALVATTDKRLKAIATVSGMMSNQTSYFKTMDRETVCAAIATANAGRQKFYETGKVEYMDALGMESLDLDSLDKKSAQYEGYQYYMTKRAGAETYPNYSHKSPTFMLETPMLADAQSYAPYLYTPYIGIYGEKALQDTGSLTVKFYEAASEPKELVEISGASHVSLYDINADVDRAITAIDTFFQKH